MSVAASLPREKEREGGWQRLRRFRRHRAGMLSAAGLALLALFSLMAVVLASVGIYGVMHYSVAQRTHEIGLRMALGARPGNVVRMVIGQGIALAAMGLAAGLIGAWWLTRLLASLLFGVTATDPLTFGAVGILLMIVAILASAIPALRAARVDPLAALRCE